jgi:hypothetical protein
MDMGYFMIVIVYSHKRDSFQTLVKVKGIYLNDIIKYNLIMR